MVRRTRLPDNPPSSTTHVIGLAVALFGVLWLAGCGVAYVANQSIARSRVDAADRADLDAGDIAHIRERYEQQPLQNLTADRLALYCDVLLKYQDLGRAGDCLDTLGARLSETGGQADSRIARALPGKKALLALASGRPEVAAQLTGNMTTPGGRYVFALAAIRMGRMGIARPIADDLRRSFDPAPVFYAASIYAALGDFPSAREVVEDPARRLLADYGVSGHGDILGNHVDSAAFRLDLFDEFDFGLIGKVTLAPAANVYVEYLAAQADLRTGGYQQAERRLDVLLASPNIEAYRDVHWRALTDRADIAVRAGDKPAAERLLRQAIDIIESIRGSVGSEAGRIAIVGDKQAPYRRMVDLLEQRGDDSDALVYAERDHGRALVDLLATRYRFGPASEAGSRSNRLVAEYDRRQGDLQIAAAGERGGREAALDQARRQLIDEAPDIADMVTVAPLDLAKIQHDLGAHEAALVYFPGESQWHVFTVTHVRITSHSVPADLLERQEADFRTTLQYHPAAWKEPAAALYRLAVAPALEGVDATSLVIVPSGPLHYVPFAALGDGTQQMVDRFALRIVPNLALITRPSGPIRPGHGLVIGDPLVNDPEFPDLPFAGKEARDVALQIGAPTTLFGAEATVPRFLELARDADLIHFAGHAVFDQDHPLDSALLFAGADRGGDRLRARQLYELRTRASLAFLSACQTGASAQAAGDDLMGMERGFFAAGVSTVIATLWPVEDETTSILVHEFYRRLGQGLSPARALQAAQIAVRANFPEPRTWAGFVVASVGSD